MKCDDCRGLIEEYVDGELSRADGIAVAAHLAACSACSDLYADLRREADIYARHHQDLVVAPDLWTNIQGDLHDLKQVRRTSLFESLSDRLRNFATVPRLSPVAGLAMLFLAIGGTVVVMRLIQTAPAPTVAPDLGPVAKKSTAEPISGPARFSAEGRDAVGVPPSTGGDTESSGKTPSVKPTVIRIVSPTPAKPTPEQLVREAEARYLEAIALLMRDVKRAKSKLDPKSVGRLNESLAAIDKTISETRLVVRQHPNDPVAVQYMLSAYSKKVDVLREISSYATVE